MKKFLFLFVGALLALPCLGQTEGAAVKTQRLSAYFTGARMRNAGGITDVDDAGVTVDYLFGFRLTQKAPLYIEAGPQVRYLTTSSDAGGYTFRENLLSLGVPFMLTADVPLPTAPGWSVQASVGFTPQFYVMGNLKETSGTGEEQNYFDWYSLGDFETKLKPFQMAWQARLSVEYKRVFLSFMFARDFTDTFDYRSDDYWFSVDDKKNKMITFNTGLGFRF